MKYLIYILFSALEYSSIFISMLVLFRYRLKDYWLEITAASFLNASLALLLASVELNGAGLIIQILAAFVTLLLLFREKLLKSFWMTISAYVMFIAVQALLLFVVNYYKLFDVTNIDPYSTETHILQVCSVALIFIINAFIRKANDGFGFSFHQKRFTSSKTMFVSVASLILLILGISFYLLFEYKIFIYFTIIVILAVISLLILIYMSAKQDDIQFKNPNKGE